MGKSTKFFFLFTSVLVIVFIVSPVLAEGNATTSSSSAANTTGRTNHEQAVKERFQNAKARNQEIRDNIKERASTAAQKRQERLSQVRLRTCKARQNIITQRTRFLHERAKLIHKAHERAFSLADKFYTEKLVPAGYTLSNYEELKAEVKANKANVITLLDAAKANAGEFDCNSEDPKGQIDAFKEDMKALIDANKKYKTSIHTFVAAVRDLAKTAKLKKVSPVLSPTPTKGVSE